MTFVPYIPAGHLGIHLGVRWIARLRNRDLMRRWDAGETRRMELELRKQSGTPLTDAERSELADLFLLWRQAEEKMAEVREQILRALMDGTLVARAVLEDGDAVDIPPAKWRSEAGQRVLQYEAREAGAPIQGRIFVEKETLLSLFGGPDTLAADWMQANAQGLKAEMAIKDCCRATGCTVREAKAAYKLLPPGKKNPRGRPRIEPA